MFVKNKIVYQSKSLLKLFNKCFLKIETLNHDSIKKKVYF